jgi:PAS domain-containing protein
LIEPVSPDRLVRVISQFLTEPERLSAAMVQAWAVTDANGVIMEISGPAHRLLNLSARGALGRNLTAFFSQERHRVVADLARAVDGQIVERDTILRPRDRRPMRVRVEIAREKDASRTVRLRWVIEPEVPATQH